MRGGVDIALGGRQQYGDDTNRESGDILESVSKGALDLACTTVTTAVHRGTFAVACFARRAPVRCPSRTKGKREERSRKRRSALQVSDVPAAEPPTGRRVSWGAPGRGVRVWVRRSALQVSDVPAAEPPTGRRVSWGAPGRGVRVWVRCSASQVSDVPAAETPDREASVLGGTRTRREGVGAMLGIAGVRCPRRRDSRQGASVLGGTRTRREDVDATLGVAGVRCPRRRDSRQGASVLGSTRTRREDVDATLGVAGDLLRQTVDDGVMPVRCTCPGDEEGIDDGANLDMVVEIR